MQKKTNANKSILVDVERLDSFCESRQILKISILKVDVEGHELAVFQGATNMLKNHNIGIVQFEKHGDDMRSDQSQIIINLLEGFGYKKVSSIKHPFGNFHEEIFALNALIF